MLKRLARSILGVTIVVISMVASARNPCSPPASIPFSPADPGPSDIVYVELDSIFGGPAFDTSYVRTRVSGGAFEVDVVISTAADNSFLVAQGFVLSGMFPDYGVATLGTFDAGAHGGTFTEGFYDGTAGGQTISSVCLGFVTLTVLPQGAPVQTAAVIEYYDPLIDHYFITQNTQEIAALDRGLFSGWVRTGQSFLAYVPGGSDNRGRPVCRWFANLVNRATHFLSGSYSECAFLVHGFGGVWQDETNDAFEIALPDMVTGTCPPQTVPVYRLWNGRPDGDHRYTTDLVTKNAMIALGYIAEGYGPDSVDMCAPLQ